MNLLVRALIPLITITLMLGCTASKKRLEQSQFRTKISSKGLKHFELTVKNGSHLQERVLHTPNARTQKKRRVKITKSLKKLAEQHLKENEYCREGFWLLESYHYSTSLQLRGECNELATQIDRENFPNTLTEW